MSQFGKILEPYNPGHEQVYRKFAEYYSDPTFYKLKDIDPFSFYYLKIRCMLCRDNRYLIAMIPRNRYPIGTPQRLSELRWSVFQSRTLPEDHPIQVHSYQPRWGILDQKLTVKNRTKEQTTYECQGLPLEVSLLHKKSELYEYPNGGSVVTALETYQTIVKLV